MKLKGVESIQFDGRWANALGELLDVLNANNCPKAVADPRIVLRSFIAPEVVRLVPEDVISNRFPVQFVPEIVHGFNLDTALDDQLESDAMKVWAFIHACGRVI